MRRWIVYCVVLGLAACASQPPPKSERRVQYEAYWNCAYHAAAPHVGDTRLSPRDVAMRAQARCYPVYLRYQQARQRYTRSLVTSNDYDMANKIAGAGSLQEKQAMTDRLIRWVIKSRNR